MIADALRKAVERCNHDDSFASRRGTLQLKKACYDKATKRAGTIYKSEEAAYEVKREIRRERERKGLPPLKERVS